MKVPLDQPVPVGAPRFLIVGACKAGTTTLYDDLAVHPDAGMPSDKEPDILHCAKDAQSALAMWRAHFAGIGSHLVRGEASTYYTMMPDFPDVSAIARDALGPSARIVYIMRHPIRRIESHLAHDFVVGRLNDTDFDRSVLEIGRYVAWSDYGRQIAPWVAAFGRDNILPVIFEEFVADRHETARTVAAFIGLDPQRLPLREKVSNVRGSQRVANWAWLAEIGNGPLYRRFLRRLMPDTLRKVVRTALTHGRPAPEITLSSATITELERRLQHVGPNLKAMGITPGRW